jgi:hypothetical protein
MRLNKIFSISLIGTAVLLAGCGGSGGGGSGSANSAAAAESSASTPQAASAAGAASAPDAASSAQTSAFDCPANYKRLDVEQGTVADVPMTMVTDDNIATLTFKTPPGGVTRAVTLCLGKPDPLPAGVQADYAYEIISGGDGSFLNLFDRTLTFSFTTTQPKTGTPAIEAANVTVAGVTYSPTISGALVSVPPNYSIAAHPNQTGLFVVRLTK